MQHAMRRYHGLLLGFCYEAFDPTGHRGRPISGNTYAHIPAEIMVPQVLVCHAEYLISGSMDVQFFAK